MKIDVYARMTPEYLYHSGEMAGLSEKATKYFSFFRQVRLELDVDRATGAIKNVKVKGDN